MLRAFLCLSQLQNSFSPANRKWFLSATKSYGRVIFSVIRLGGKLFSTISDAYRGSFFLTSAITSLFVATGLTAQDWPKTVVETSNYDCTSTVADIHSYMDAIIKIAPALKAYHPQNAPKTTETGKPILAWRIPATGKNPLRIYINANIHAGEVEGKEAVLFIVREILQGKHADIHKEIDLVVCPAYNADGTDALNPANRPYQPNPKSGVGSRENVFGLDLNRDMMKAVAANTKWMLAMYRDFDPDCTIDLHATNGSRHGFYLTHAPANGIGGDIGLEKFNRQMLVEIRDTLKAKGLPTYDYGNFGMDSDRQPVRWESDSVSASNSLVSNYPILENRLGVLVETYVYRSYEDRIEDNVRFLLETLQWMARHKGEVQHERKQATERWNDACSKGNLQFPLTAKPTETETYNFEAFEFAKDDQGKPLRDERGRYVGDRTTKQLTLPSFVSFEWADYVTAPVGYLVDRAYADRIRPLLEAHGVNVLPGTQRPKNETLMYFHETDRKISQGAFQGVFTLSLSGNWKPELPAKRAAYSWEPEDLDSAMYVPINQPMGRLAFYLLDPRASDGLVFWGYFHSSFIRGRGMWGEEPRTPILALGINATEKNK